MAEYTVGLDVIGLLCSVRLFGRRSCKRNQLDTLVFRYCRDDRLGRAVHLVHVHFSDYCWFTAAITYGYRDSHVVSIFGGGRFMFCTLSRRLFQTETIAEPGANAHVIHASCGAGGAPAVGAAHLYR